MALGNIEWTFPCKWDDWLIPSLSVVDLAAILDSQGPHAIIVLALVSRIPIVP